ncbi:hypothetical protein [Sporisorium scitamineum]|uniref:Uncharacterized protein n=1 Tax=Sporisorium scitamineum TaxID=49012 RepID=A0A0F7S1D5_9BASI|nr:hypothetical protein [Sporisorium scitamineum]
MAVPLTGPHQREADAASERADELAAKNKQLEQELLTKDQEIASLQHKLSVAEGDLDKLESKLHEHKSAREEHESNATNSESLQRKAHSLHTCCDRLTSRPSTLSDRWQRLSAKWRSGKKSTKRPKSATCDGDESDRDDQEFQDAWQEQHQTQSSDNSEPSGGEDDDGVVGMVHSLSQRTLALIAPLPIHDLLATLVGIWAHALLILLASTAVPVAVSDAGDGETAYDVFVDAQADLKPNVDEPAVHQHAQVTCQALSCSE